MKEEFINIPSTMNELEMSYKWIINKLETAA